jgi:preprotein translocase subunit YajC
MQYLLPLLLLMALYFVYMPQRRRTQAQRQLVASLAPGDDVITAGGVFGTIVSIEGDRAMLEVAPDVEMEFLVASIVRRLATVSDDAPEEEPPDTDADADVDAPPSVVPPDDPAVPRNEET